VLFNIGLPNGDWKPIAPNPPMSPLLLVEQHVPGSTSTMSNFPKQKKLHLGRRLTWHKYIFAKRKYLASHSPKCTGCLAVSLNFL
jgi:hypothetical protein